MSSDSAKILLTGLPGCGKTTAIMQIIEHLDSSRLAGFYTREIRHGKKRLGFRWTRLDGATGTLAHVGTRERPKVGKYGVDVKGFEKSIVPILDVEQSSTELFVIDEIGKMECLSQEFVAAVRRLFASNRSVLATVAKKGSGFILEVKSHPGTQLFNLTAASRDKTVAEISQILSFLRKPL